MYPLSFVHRGSHTNLQPKVVKMGMSCGKVMKILLIEDDLRLAQLIVRQLQREQHSADVAHDGEMGLELALRGDYDALIVDWMLPKRDGPSI